LKVHWGQHNVDDAKKWLLWHYSQLFSSMYLVQCYMEFYTSTQFLFIELKNYVDLEQQLNSSPKK